jgi:hypothetical protein
MTILVTRRSMIAVAAAGAAAPALPSAGAGAPADPILAFIADHRAALETAIETDGKWGDLRSSDPLYDHMADLSGAAWDGADKALHLVLTCRPTTLAGAVAALEHVSLPEFLNTPGDGRTILAAEIDRACDDELKAAAESFGRRLAVTMRELIAKAAA